MRFAPSLVALPASPPALPPSGIFARVRGALVPLVDRATARLAVSDPRIDALATALDPTLSTHTVRARVVSVITETRDAKTFVLRPNARWKGFSPGAFVTLRVRIDGETFHRSYSLSSAPSSDGLVSITVKRVDGGRVSAWLVDHVTAGDVLEIGLAQGQFILPTTPPAKALFISAGSGITPVMSMLRHLVRDSASAAAVEIAFLHYARTPDEIIFRDELAYVAHANPTVRLALAVEDADASWPGLRGRFTPNALDATAPDWRERPIFLCGPPPFMKAVMGALEAGGYDLSRLAYERFSADVDVAQFFQAASLVRFRRSNVEALANKPRSILEEAEARGLKPTYGCRIGACGSCRCDKLAGVVVDATTGRASGEGKESILPCVSIARGAVEVDL